MRIKILIALVVVGLLSIGLYLWFSRLSDSTNKPNISTISEMVRQSMIDTLKREQKGYIVNIISVTLINTGLNSYDGMARLTLTKGWRSVDLDTPIKVTADKTNTIWKMESGALTVFANAALSLEDKSKSNNADKTQLNMDLFESAARGDLARTKSCIDKGASVDANEPKSGMTTLMAAIMNGQLEIVQALLAKGADVNAKAHIEDMTITVLMAAIRNGQLEIVQALLAKGADVNAKEPKSGMTTLMLASREGHLEIVRALIDRGADVNAKDDKDRTALEVAAVNGHREIVEVLLTKGADVNAKDKDGFTALMTASEGGHREVVNILLAKGADVNVTDNDGTTALMLATRRGHQEVKELLQRVGAK